MLCSLNLYYGREVIQEHINVMIRIIEQKQTLVTVY